jgi:hypothetical protein
MSKHNVKGVFSLSRFKGEKVTQVKSFNQSYKASKCKNHITNVGLSASRPLLLKVNFNFLHSYFTLSPLGISSG